MSGFSAKWLELREPLDLAARNLDVEDAFLDALSSKQPKLLDFACGAGSTVKALSERLPERTDWLLVDYDPVLLSIAEENTAELTSGHIRTKQLDLSKDLNSLPVAEADGISTSAFLDLASERFLDELSRLLAKSGKPFLASLSYDGRAHFYPKDSFDKVILEALNTHQKTDKGLGLSLGPDAAARMIDMFEALGCKILQGVSDWKIGPESQVFLQEFLSGWVRVGKEMKLDPVELERWWSLRRSQIEEGTLSMTVGHIDFAVLPTSG